MIILTVKFETKLSEEEVLGVAESRIDQFRALSGLVQKYYVRLGQPNCYAGILVWDSMESLNAYRESELAATVAERYEMTGPPTVEVSNVLIQMRKEQPAEA